MATPKLTKLHAALKTLSTAPYDAQKIQDEGNAKVADIKSNKKYEMFSDLWKNKQIDAINTETNRKIKTLSDAMLKAVDDIEAGEEIENQRVDMSNQKLQNAISLITLLGKELDGKQQVDLLDGFKGDFASLGVIIKLFEKYDLYYKDYAESLLTPVDPFALTGIKEACYRFEAGMPFSLGSTIFHIGNFAKAMKQYGLNPDENPYETAMESVQFKKGEMTQKNMKAVATARELIQNDRESETVAEQMTRAGEIMGIVSPILASDN